MFFLYKNNHSNNSIWAIFGNKRTIVPYLFTGNSTVISLARAELVISIFENKLNFNISLRDCNNSKRLCPYFRNIPQASTIAERLRRSLKSVIVTGDVRFVGSKPNLVTFLLSNMHLFVLLKFNC